MQTLTRQYLKINRSLYPNDPNELRLNRWLSKFHALQATWQGDATVSAYSGGL